MFETVCQISSHLILPLRTRVLRPHFAPEQLAHFEGDDDPRTTHYALRHLSTQTIVGCATLRCAPLLEAPCLQLSDQDHALAIQLRGMSIAPEHQGRGLGARLLDALLIDAATRYAPSRIIWCHARQRAASLYARHGFEIVGDLFEIEGVGPHWRMWRALPWVIAEA